MMPRPVDHLVLFKLKPDATPEQKEAMRAGLLSLRERVPGILDLTCGLNFSDRAAGHEIGLVVRLESRAALEGYIPHPAHREVVERDVRPIMESIIVVDYEI